MHQNPRRQKECDAGKIFEEIMTENFPKFSERYKLTHSRSWIHPKQDKLKEIHTQTQHKQTTEILRWRRYLENSQRKKDSLPIGKSWFNTAGFSADTMDVMGSDEVFWKYKRKEPSTWNSKSIENIPQEGSWRNKEVFQWRKTKGLDSSRPALEKPIKFFRKKGDLLVPPQQLSSWCPPEPNVASRCKEWIAYVTHRDFNMQSDLQRPMMVLKTVSRIKDLHTQWRQYPHLDKETGEFDDNWHPGPTENWDSVRTKWYQCGPGSHTEDRRYQKTLDTGPETRGGVGTVARILLSPPAEVTSPGSFKALTSRS